MSANLEAGLRHQEAESRLQALRHQARELETLHGTYDKAIKQVPPTALFHMSECSFLKLQKDTAKTALKASQARIWSELEGVQREIVKLEREILRIEIAAGLENALGTD